MEDAQRASLAKRKRKYRSDGTPFWEKRYIDGPGVWVSCVKGKEKQAVAESYDLFEFAASEIWPQNERDATDPDPSDGHDEELSIEAQIANEVSAMKRQKKEPLFANCQTNTPCVAFISCKPPIDPVKLVIKIVKDVETTGVVRSRSILRLVPISASCGANLSEIQTLCRSVLESFFSQHPDKVFRFKVELRVRNHTVLSRPALLQHIAQCVPAGHTVDLTNPELFILVEIFKNVCGVSVVEGYYALQKFNLTEIANARLDQSSTTEGGIHLRGSQLGSSIPFGQA